MVTGGGWEFVTRSKPPDGQVVMALFRGDDPGDPCYVRHYPQGWTNLLGVLFHRPTDLAGIGPELWRPMNQLELDRLAGLFPDLPVVGLVPREQ